VAEWVDLAVEVARWDVLFDELADEEGLAQAHQDFRRSLNSDFSASSSSIRPWVQGTAPGRRSRPTWSLSRGAAAQARERTRAGGDRLPAARPVAHARAAAREHFEIEREHYCSICPRPRPTRATPSSRGLLPAELYERHPDLWQENQRRRALARTASSASCSSCSSTGLKAAPTARSATSRSTTRAKRSRPVVSRALRGLGLVALVYNFIDILSHGRSESELLQELAPDEAAFRAVMKAWFVHSPLYEILRSLGQQGFAIVLTTDHGSVLARAPPRCTATATRPPTCATSSDSTSIAIPRKR
jgi:hypothetical protein